MENKNTSSFFSKLLESREKAHIFHLQIKSYENHIATEFYYEKIVKLLDSLIESYQGKYNIVESYQITNPSNETNPIKYFEDLSKYIESNRFEFFNEKDTFLQNQVDEILEVLYKTLYKLKYLK